MLKSMRRILYQNTKNLRKIKKHPFANIPKQTLKVPKHNFSNQNEDNSLFKLLKKYYKQKAYKVKHWYRRHKWQSQGLLFFFIALTGYYFYIDEVLEKIQFSEFESLLLKNYIRQITIFDDNYNYIVIETKDRKRKKVNIFNSKEIVDLCEHLKDQSKITTSLIYKNTKSTLDLDQIQNIFFHTLVGGFFFYTIYKLKNIKGNSMDILGIEGMKKTQAKKYVSSKNLNQKFSDIAGISEAKLEIMEFVDYLKHPKKYQELGARLPKGALLTGPPGTGKTLLAKACANESKVSFFYTSGSEFIEEFVGVGASRVRDLFAEAKKSSPAIIFIDEIDAIGKKRSDQAGNSEMDQTINQLLVEMDGFDTKQNVVVFAATNRKDILDPALLRPGRLDRIIDVQLPDLDGRRKIFTIHLKKLRLESQEFSQKMAKRLASLTPGFSGADIAHICNEAAIQAVRDNNDYVSPMNFELAVERVIGGLEKKTSVSQLERNTVAVHESGHGVVAWYLKGADPLLKLTIIPRTKGALGFAQYLPDEGALQTKENLEDKIVSILAGRVAEEEFFGEVTTGAFDDFQKAYRIAHQIVTKLGMDEELGYVSHQEDQGVKTYSEKTNKLIDEACIRIIKENTERCRELVKKHRVKIQEMSDLLLDKDTITLVDIIGILGPRPFEVKDSFKAYLEESQTELELEKVQS